MMKHLVMALALSLTAPVFAEGLPGDPDEGQPDIRIYHEQDNTYYEYSVNGQVREIKVVPAVGAPYYLVPSNADGKMVRVEQSTLLIPKWVIFRW
jgi:hypothetical protein